jgi:CRISPR-associated protein Cas2
VGQDRSHYIIAYDIRNDQRRRRVAKVLEGHGERVQYSVFECLLTANQFNALWEELGELLEPEQDSLRTYRLCAACERWTKTIGQAKTVEVPEVYIV